MLLSAYGIKEKQEYKNEINTVFYHNVFVSLFDFIFILFYVKKRFEILLLNSIMVSCSKLIISNLQKIKEQKSIYLIKTQKIYSLISPINSSIFKSRLIQMISLQCLLYRKQLIIITPNIYSSLITCKPNKSSI
ncbi:MAG: hypothetical protein A2X08_11975 [Bacteroidetes bacterium GWA2_32_17]|nr:MAG: hypothetical protein A2X08_11975 [Bacteroidetes bacterium GWA2_32_17]